MNNTLCVLFIKSNNFISINIFVFEYSFSITFLYDLCKINGERYEIEDNRAQIRIDNGAYTQEPRQENRERLAQISISL